MRVSLPGATLASPTIGLFGLNILVFIAMVASGISYWEPQTGELLRWGANFGPLTMQGQWWRLLSSIFLHVGIIHLAVNMWGLWVLGRVGEFLYGNWRFLGLYLLSGLGGSVASIARNPMVVSAGASGALFGIAGALLASSLLGTGASPLRLAPNAVRSLVLVIAANLAFGLLYTRIDNGAHIGGLVTGFVLGAIVSLDFRRAIHGWKLSPALVLFPLVGIMITGSAAYVSRWRGPEIGLTLGREALQRGDASTALRYFQQAVVSSPNDATAHEALASAYALSRKPSLARQEYARALELNPSSVKLYEKLAIAEVQTGNREKGAQLLEEASRRSPNDAGIFFELGVLYQQMGNDKQALAPLEKAAALQPGSPVILQALGISYTHAGQNEQAIAALEQARKLAPQSADVLMALANAYERQGMSQAADQAYRQAYQLRSRQRN